MEDFTLNYVGADRLEGFNKPRVWTIMNSLAVQTGSVNLGQGFPSWDPPSFYLKHMEQAVSTSTHQYTVAYGSPKYLQSIANFHRNTFRDLDFRRNIVGVNGGSEGLYCCIMGLVNIGEQVIIFDPAYDVYRPQVQMAGGKTIGITLKPRKKHTKEELLKRFSQGVIQSNDQDEWDYDFEQLENAINEKTKILIITSPHNPVGKVFTQEQLGKIANLMRKHPHVIIIEDNVYQGMTFDNLYGKPLPKIINQPDMYDRVITIYSGGKIFQATGSRSGWVIGPEKYIKYVKSAYQVTCFCQFSVLENAVAKSLADISQQGNTYLRDYAKNMIDKRNLLLKQLVNSKYQFDLWVPKGSHFILADISQAKIDEKYLYDENGQKRTRDYAFAHQLALENKVVCIPCSPFYDPSNLSEGEKYVRFAFCKGDELILQAGKRLRQ